MNHLANVEELHNYYFAMRHGPSIPNERGVINSDCAPDIQAQSGLVELGRTCVRLAVENSNLSSETIIYASPFSRTLETADIARDVIGAREVWVANELRERGFGGLEGDDHSKYHRVWADDEIDPDYAEDGVEPVSDVLRRTTSLILSLEEKHQGEEILLVSHGDPLQILYTGFRKKDPRLHRSMPHLKPADIQDMRLAQPEAVSLAR